MNHLRQTLIVVMSVVAIVSLVTFGFTFSQVGQEKQRLQADLEYRSSLLATSVKEPIETDFTGKTKEDLQKVVNRFSDDQRLTGLAIIDGSEKTLATSSDSISDAAAVRKIAVYAMDSNKATSEFVRSNGQNLHIFVEPLRNRQGVIGAIVVAQNAAFIDNYVAGVWQRNLLRLTIQAVIFSIAILIILRWVVHAPLQRLIASMQSAKSGKAGVRMSLAGVGSMFEPVIQEFSNINKSLARAKQEARQATKSSIDKLDSPWTAERLHQFTKDLLKNRDIIAVSNREPYVHYKEGNEIRHMVPASGMVTALEPVMQACGGMWIAHGSGDADMLVTDAEDKIAVPPNEGTYTLKRVWLSKSEVEGHYEGFSNGALWPLCHMVHTRPKFRQRDWEGYKRVNRKFADAVLKEIKGKKNPIVIIQDYHFALLPKLIKEARPDAAVSIFWHIPWPNSEAFSICPWKKELLDGLLGADIVGFHTQLFCNNFINTAGRELEALIDLEQFSVTRGGHTSYIKPFPISIDFTGQSTSKADIEAENQAAKKLREELGIKSAHIGIGVDRLDYTKGILERVKAIELFLEQNPQYQSEFTFVQISAPSRTSVDDYREFDRRVTEEVDRINNAYRQGNWKPIILIKEHRNHDYLMNLYRLADFCLVTPLHDGMNLVAKEFIASRNDERGVLILSQYAGASQELRDALIINPYDGHQSAEAIRQAIEMQPAEQARRMKKMRESIKTHNVYRWSAEMLKRIDELD